MKPSARTIQTGKVGRVPRCFVGSAVWIAQSRSTTANGPAETSSVAMPEGTYCSAQQTRPLPPSMRKRPTMALSRHCFAVGRIFFVSQRKP